MFHLSEGILSTFDEMSMDEGGKFNADTVSKAVSHTNALERFDFIIALVITRKVFDATMEVKKQIKKQNYNPRQMICIRH